MFLVKESNNVKVGKVSATYAPIAQTCPETCPLRGGNGCYAEGGNVGFQMRRLQRELAGLNGDTLAVLEANEISDAATQVPQGRPLRLHVSGDAATPKRVSTLATAARRWPGPVWTYTHAWRDVPREAWGGVSVLASCESTKAANEALDAGYAPAVVTGKHPEDGRAYVKDGVRFIPCPAQTRDVTCEQCRLCFKADTLHASRSAIAFEVHGSGKKRALTVLQTKS